MTDSLKNVTIYLNDERLARIEAIVAELTQRTGFKISRSAAIGRAIDDLFLSVCPNNQTNGQYTTQPEPATADAV